MPFQVLTILAGPHCARNQCGAWLGRLFERFRARFMWHRTARAQDARGLYDAAVWWPNVTDTMNKHQRLRITNTMGKKEGEGSTRPVSGKRQTGYSRDTRSPIASASLVIDYPWSRQITHTLTSDVTCRYVVGTSRNPRRNTSAMRERRRRRSNHKRYIRAW